MKIIKTSKKSVDKFANNVWKKFNISQFGRNTNWISKTFCFKIVDKNKIAGIVIGDFKGGVVFVDEFIIEETYRNKGVGRKLMSKVFSYSKQNKGHKIYLFTGLEWPSNFFYKKLGFEKIGNLSNHYVNHDYVIYQKFL